MPMTNPFFESLTSEAVEAAIPDIRVLRILGVGGQGIAMEVETTNTDFEVAALKIYSPETVVARVDREIEKLSLLESDFVVRLYSHGTATIQNQQCRFALMEYIEGTELSSLVGKFNISELDYELRQLLTEIGQGICDMWKLRIVHRDIKPANVMRRANGRYVILDLGLAKHLDASTLTQIGYTCGTRGYMSPEQAEGRRGLTLRSDMFALGLIAYEVATGVHPFSHRQELIGRFPIRPIRELRPEISIEVADLIENLLTIETIARPSKINSLATST